MAEKTSEQADWLKCVERARKEVKAQAEIVEILSALDPERAARVLAAAAVLSGAVKPTVVLGQLTRPRPGERAKEDDCG